MADMLWVKKRPWVNAATGETLTLTDERAMEAITTGYWDLRPPNGITWAVRIALINEDAEKLLRDTEDFEKEAKTKREAAEKAQRAVDRENARIAREKAAEEKRVAAAAKKAEAAAKKAGKLVSA